MKLGRELLLLTVSAQSFFPASSVVGQADFPARGFSPILDDVQAEQICKLFQQECFFRDPVGGYYHQGLLYRFDFMLTSPKSGQPVVHYGLLSGPYPNAPSFASTCLFGPDLILCLKHLSYSSGSKHSRYGRDSRISQK